MTRRCRVLIATVGCFLLVISPASRATAQSAAEIAAAFEQLAAKWEKELKGARTPTDFKTVAEEALLCIDPAEDAEQFTAAKRLAVVSTTAAAKAKDPLLARHAVARDKELATYKKEWDVYHLAAKTLNEGRLEPEAYLTVGRFLTFVKGDWELGLSKLTQGPEVTLKDLAAKTLAAAADAESQHALGDAWWHAAEKTTGKPKSEFVIGAIHAYSQALPGLTGPTKAALQKRLADMIRASDRGKSFPGLIEMRLSADVSLRLRLVPAGTFVMGSPESEKNRSAYEEQHQVTFTHPFYVGTTEVTQDQWTAVFGRRSPSAFFDDVKLPVERVSWNNVGAFLERLNKRPMRRKYHFRLPTSAEWEYACRAGSTSAYYFGDDATQLGEYAWYATNAGGKTHPVAQLKPNAWGLFDMLGNVHEWTSDLYVPDKLPPPLRSKLSGDERAARGGSWTDQWCRCAGFWYFPPADLANVFGFRVVCDILH